jgi:DoxX-like family
MRILLIVLQVVVALGLLNVWLLRFGQSTAYRGGDARSMREEFARYGLPSWFMLLIGTLKVGAALCLIAGVWLHSLVLPAAALICALMIGALAMHVKIRDPLKKSLPALLVLAASACICWGSTH